MAVGKPTSQRTSKSHTAEITSRVAKVWLDIPHFTFTKKVGTEYPEYTAEEIKAAFGVDGPIRDVSGDLVSIGTRLGDYEGKPIHNVTLELVDYERDETVYLKYTVGGDLGRRLANSLLNLTGYINVQIGLYGQANKETKKVYPAVAVRQGGAKETVKGKFDAKTDPHLQPRLFEGQGFKPGGKLSRDFSAADEFLFGELIKLGDALRANPAPARQSTASSALVALTRVAIPETVPAGVSEDEDGPDGPLPF